MFDELFHSIMEQWSNISVSFFNGLEGPKILGVLIPLLPACYGLYIKWRSSGYRLLDRLDEYLDQQEKRLAISRKAVHLCFNVRHLPELLINQLSIPEPSANHCVK